MVLISIKNLTKKFYNKKIIDNFSWNIEKGDIWALIGSNGSGKTTILNILIGLGDQDKGKITYNYPYSNHFSEKIGFLFQNNTYPKNLTAADIIYIYKKSYNFSKSIFIELVNLLQIKTIMNKKIKHLSGGELQKLNIFFVFLNSPEIIILDEFSNNLDIRTKINMRNYFLKYVKTKNATGIIVSHDIEEITYMCNKLIHIENGKIKNLIKNSKYINKENITKLFLENEIDVNTL